MSEGRSPPMDPFAFLDATAQADLVRRKEVTPVELVDAAIARIERLNPRLNAVVTPMYELARRAALGQRAAGSVPAGHIIGDNPTPPESGTPPPPAPRLFGPARNPWDTGRTTGGSSGGSAAAGAAGFMPMAHANGGGRADRPPPPRLFGPARSPGDTGRPTGGSSGGSAAAVAAGFMPMAHANDGGRSIRI